MGKPSAECADGFLLEFLLYIRYIDENWRAILFVVRGCRTMWGIEPYDGFAILFIWMKMGG